MNIHVSETKEEMGAAAAVRAAELLKSAISEKGQAAFIVATGASQFEFLDALTSTPGIDWSKTTMFHLDEYVGLPMTHPASFRRYLTDRLVDKVHPGTVNLVAGDADDPHEECARLDAIITKYTIDVAFVGIGENGHLAFNDPPADFETEKPYLVVELDEACRRQQMGEGWFPTLDDVPTRAISMSIKQIMKSRAILCIVPDSRKAEAVKNCLEQDISPIYPASILRTHPNVDMFLDTQAAALLNKT